MAKNKRVELFIANKSAFELEGNKLPRYSSCSNNFKHINFKNMFDKDYDLGKIILQQCYAIFCYACFNSSSHMQS